MYAAADTAADARTCVPMGAPFVRLYEVALIWHPMANDNERPRAFPRFEVEARVDYTGTEILLNHRIQNLSLGGMCIAGDAVEDLGTTVDLVINFPELQTSITARGEVVWANAEPPMDMGIRFLDLDSERKETLRRYLSLAAA